MVVDPDRVVEHWPSACTLEDAYVEVLAAVDQSAVRGADETSWQRAGQTQWLSVATAEQAALFQIAERRDGDSAKGTARRAPRRRDRL
jgi:hypothetical protein